MKPADIPLDKLRSILRSRRKDHIEDLNDHRRQMEGFATDVTDLIGRHEIVQVAGIPCEVFTPRSTTSSAVIVYLHGGAFVAGSPATHRKLVDAIADKSGVSALSIDYRLAPEHRYPAALDDAISVVTELRNRGEGFEDLIIIGDSAGGGLAVDLIQTMDARAMAPASCAVLLSPWLDVEMRERADPELEEKDPVLTVSLLKQCADWFQARSGDVKFSPLERPAKTLPPLLIQVGSDEILLPDANRLAAAMRVAGGDVNLSIWDGLFHVWQAYLDHLPEARRAIDEIANFVRERAPQAS